MTLDLRDHVGVTETEDGAVLLDERAGRYWQLNGTGTFVLAMLRSGHDAERVADHLKETYGVDRDRALADVAAVVDSLRRARLVRR